MASGLYSFSCKAEEWSRVWLDYIRLNFKPLECLQILYVREAALVNEDLRHHEVGNYDGDNHGVVLVDRVDVEAKTLPLMF